MLNKSNFENELKQSISGDVHFDAVTRRVYSVDASIYEIEPIGIVVPKYQEDLLKAMQIAKRYKIPIIPRGAATGITGGCIGHGLILDLSKYLNNIEEINLDKEYVICEAGVIQDQLNAFLSPAGYRLGPDTSTGNRATLGGMLANNAAGARSLHYGKMVDHIESVTIATSEGNLITLEALSKEQIDKKCAQDNFEGQIYRSVKEIIKTYHQDIETHFPKIPRRVSGYNLDELIKDTTTLNLAKIIAGSEGTLGTIVKMKLRISRKPKLTGLCVLHCDDLILSMHAIPSLLSHSLLSLEMLDHRIIEAGKIHPTLKNKLHWLKGSPKAIFIAELQAQNDQELRKKLEAVEKTAKDLNIAYATTILTDPQEMNAVWEVRKSGLGLLLSKRSYSRAIAFIEDISIPPEQLALFMQDFLACLKRFNKEAGVYGHIGSGCMHIRPYIDLRSQDEQKIMQELMLAVADLLLKYGGALSGEHGDGYVRSWLNKKMFGDNLYKAFCQLKAAFDPDNLLNPGKIVHAASLLHDLRSIDTKPVPEISTFLDFTPEGGFDLAVDLCNGNGLCRKTEGVMCPSFQATHDEYDSTRARAQALRGFIHGHLPLNADLLDVMDLCLQCKGCKTECPSQVDMAKMKSEMLFQYQQNHGYSLRTRLFGHFGTWMKRLSPFSKIVNLIMHSTFGNIMQQWIGISNKRTLPSIANERFSQWFANQPKHIGDKKVLLFNDTFTEFNHPEIGRAAVAVLQAMNYTVIVLPWKCCGRTLFSKGMLQEAKKKTTALISQFSPFIEEGIPIITLEPSCHSMLIDDIEGLQGQSDLLKKLKTLSISFDDFVHHHVMTQHLPMPLINTPIHYLLHGHCHQKALIGMESALKLLNTLPGCSATLIDSGCCGMAGSFGFEKEHEEISMKIGALKLFPDIFKASESTQIIANGISCRQQIHDGTKRQAFHLAEAIAQRLQM